MLNFIWRRVSEYNSEGDLAMRLMFRSLQYPQRLRLQVQHFFG